MHDPIVQVFEVYIRTKPETLWAAITQPEFTKLYFMDAELRSDLKVGSRMAYCLPDGDAITDGKIIEIEPQRRLVQTWVGLVPPESERDPESKVTWEITQLGDTCLLRVVHEHYAGVTRTSTGTAHGWNIIFSGLKTLLETGSPLHIPSPQPVGKS